VKTLDCLETDRGSMCLPCFHQAIDSGKEDITSLPEPGRRVYVLLWDEPGISFVTMRGVLYAFDQEEAATLFLDEIRKTGLKDPIKIRRIPSDAVLQYVMSQPGLKMKGMAALGEDALEGGTP
jgi:hypothetical protein